MKLFKIINFPRAIKWNADCVFKVDDIILYEVQTSWLSTCRCEINQGALTYLHCVCLFFCFFQIIWTALINFGLSFLILHCRQLHLMQIEHLFLFQSSLENSKTAWITDTCLWSAVCGHDCNLPKIFFYTISPIIFIHYFYTLKSIVRHLCFDNKRYSFDGINLLSDCIKLQQLAPQIPT